MPLSPGGSSSPGPGCPSPAEGDRPFSGWVRRDPAGCGRPRCTPATAAEMRNLQNDLTSSNKPLVNISMHGCVSKKKKKASKNYCCCSGLSKLLRLQRELRAGLVSQCAAFCGSFNTSVPQFLCLKHGEGDTGQFNCCAVLYRDIMKMGSAPKPLHFCCWVEKGYTSSHWVAPVRRS